MIGVFSLAAKIERGGCWQTETCVFTCLSQEPEHRECWSDFSTQEHPLLVSTLTEVAGLLDG